MTSMTPTGEYENRAARDLDAGDRVWIDGRWQEVECADVTGGDRIEVITKPHSEGFLLEPTLTLPTATGEVGERNG